MTTIPSRGHGDKLSRKAGPAVLALLEQPSITAAAAQIGVNEATLRKWMKLPEFQKLLRQTGEQSFEHGLIRLQAAGPGATDYLVNVLGTEMEDTKHKVKAAEVLLAHVLKAAELVDHRERLEAIEERLGIDSSKSRNTPP